MMQPLTSAHDRIEQLGERLSSIARVSTLVQVKYASKIKRLCQENAAYRKQIKEASFLTARLQERVDETTGQLNAQVVVADTAVKSLKDI